MALKLEFSWWGENTVKKLHISLIILVIVVSLFVVSVAQSQQEADDARNESAISAPGLSVAQPLNPDAKPLDYWYGCEYGHYQPACNALIIPALPDPNMWYACHYGHYQPACDAIR